MPLSLHSLDLQVYKGFLEELHFHRVLEEAKIEKIFANLSELCEVRGTDAKTYH